MSTCLWSIAILQRERMGHCLPKDPFSAYHVDRATNLLRVSLPSLVGLSLNGRSCQQEIPWTAWPNLVQDFPKCFHPLRILRTWRVAGKVTLRLQRRPNCLRSCRTPLSSEKNPCAPSLTFNPSAVVEAMSLNMIRLRVLRRQPCFTRQVGIARQLDLICICLR